MNPKSTGILFVVALALGAFVYFYEIEGEQERLIAEEQAQRLFSDFDAEDVTAIELVASDGAGVRAERGEARWKLVAPLEFPADSASFDAMASGLSLITGEDAIEDPQPADVYGLGADDREVRFVANDQQYALRIGDKAPVGSKTYVARGGEASVYTVPTTRVNAFARSLTDLRDKRILDFDRESVNHIEATWPGGRVVLVRSDTGWVLEEPVESLADAQVIDNLLSDLAFLRADGFEDDPPADAATGLDEPAFVVRLSSSTPGDASGPVEREIAIGGVEHEDELFVRGAHASLYRIGAARLDDFPTRVAAYRDKQMAAFDPTAAERIDIVFHSEEGETIAIQAERTEAGWTSAPEAFQPGMLAALAGTLANLRAEDIAAESMGTDERRGVDLEPANAVFRVFGSADSEAPESEPPLLAEVHVGALRGSAGILAQRPGDDIVYVLDYELAEKLPVSHEAFANRFRAEPAPPAASEPSAP